MSKCSATVCKIVGNGAFTLASIYSHDLSSKFLLSSLPIRQINEGALIKVEVNLVVATVVCDSDVYYVNQALFGSTSC